MIAAPSRQIDVTDQKNMLLLVQLRWTAVVGQVATIAITEYAFGIDLPVMPMAMVVVALILLNLASLLLLKAGFGVTNAELFVALALDAAALTAQLYLSGGATNPFVFLFLLQVMLSAVLLKAWSVWAMFAVTIACFAGLIVQHRPLALPAGHEGDLFRLHITGMLACFALNGALLVVFVARIGDNLRERDARLAALRQRAAEEDHIVRMGLLASGAAHELGTPLATLDVILNDWGRVPKLANDKDLADEIADMQAEVRRCKSIVTGILLAAGEARGEAPKVTTVRAFLDEIVADRRSARPAGRIDFDNAFGEDLQIVSDSALKQVIAAVIDNAAEASPQGVGVTARRERHSLILLVADSGPGFEAEMLNDFGKPYRSSKGRPGGGLGLFLVVNVMRKLGGGVSARNREGGGAEVTLTLPLGGLAIGSAVDG